MNNTRKWGSALACVVVVGWAGACGDSSPSNTTAACRTDSDCDDARFCTGVERCDRDNLAANAQGCVAGESPCTAAEHCVEATNACLTDCQLAADADGDGFDSITCGGEDCDDSRWSINPEANENCNGFDDDCNGAIDDGVQQVYYLDADGDGFGTVASSIQACAQPPGYASLTGDCVDQNPALHPGAMEWCNGVDDNCVDGSDEGCDCVDGSTRACGEPADSGGFVDDGECEIGLQLCVGGIWGACLGDVRRADEQCDNRDNDCDGEIDEGLLRTCYADRDGDNYGYGPALTLCAGDGGYGGCPTGYTSRGSGLELDCDDNLAAIQPGASELCNGRDDNCDGVVDTDGGFACAQGQVDFCATACDSAGRRDCGLDCNWVDPICRAPLERCDYCDDNGLLGFADERELAVASFAQNSFTCEGVTRYGTASCPTGYLRINTGSTSTTTTGGLALASDQRVGFGPLELSAWVHNEGSGGENYGWALVVYHNTTQSFIGSGGANRGVNVARSGVVAEIYPSATNHPIAVSSLTGTSARTNEFNVANAYYDWLELSIEPDWPGTAANEMVVRLGYRTTAGGTPINTVACAGAECAALIQTGDFVDIGLTASGEMNTSFWLEYGGATVTSSGLCE